VGKRYGTWAKGEIFSQVESTKRYSDEWMIESKLGIYITVDNLSEIVGDMLKLLKDRTFHEMSLTELDLVGYPSWYKVYVGNSVEMEFVFDSRFDDLVFEWESIGPEIKQYGFARRILESGKILVIRVYSYGIIVDVR
jgi:hypothetical protein